MFNIFENTRLEYTFTGKFRFMVLGGLISANIATSIFTKCLPSAGFFGISYFGFSIILAVIIGIIIFYCYKPSEEHNNMKNSGHHFRIPMEIKNYDPDKIADRILFEMKSKLDNNLRAVIDASLLIACGFYGIGIFPIFYI